jgi:DNA-binding MarR family transcriptional regulator
VNPGEYAPDELLGLDHTSGRYRVVGCPDCRWLWILDREEDSRRTTCSRCESTWERRRAHGDRPRLRTLASADDIQVAREQRGRMLADQAGYLEAALEFYDDWGVIEDRVQESIERDRERYADLISYDRESQFQTAADAYLQRQEQPYAQLVEQRMKAMGPVPSEAQEPPEPPGVASIRTVAPGDQPDLDRLPVRNLGPRVTEWVPELLEALLPTLCRAAWDMAPEAFSRAVEDGQYRRTAGVLVEEMGLQDPELDAHPGLQVGMVEYVYWLAEWTLAELGDRELDEDRRDRARHALTHLGTGRGDANAGVPALNVVARLLAEAGDAPVLRVYLDASAWEGLDHRDTGERALDALRRLAHGIDIELVLSSPGLVRALRRRFEDWLDEHLSLTGTDDWYRAVQDSRSRKDTPAVDVEEALSQVTQPGQIRLLANLPPDGSPRQQRQLVGDPDVELSESGVSRAVSTLVQAGLVERDTVPVHNHVALTDAGQAALSYVSDDYTIRHPQQQTLGPETPVLDDFTETRHAHTGTVYRAHRHGRGGEGGQSIEEALQRTGAAEEAGYVQWLDGSDDLGKWAVHKRITGVQRGDGITLVDDRNGRFEDGRVTKISCFDDEFLTVVQWGGAIPTMARLASALLSDRALSKVLGPEQTGDEFEELLNGEIEGITGDVLDVLQAGLQTGWVSKGERRYEDWRERYGNVKAGLLELVGTVGNDVEKRTALMKDLHGLIASATQLYTAAGIDVVFNVRMPDTGQLASDERRLNEFLDFLRYTATKNTVYGVHSGPRMLLEDRESKLKHRLAYEVDPDDATMDLTASWVVSGPTMTELQEEIRRAVQRENDDVREQVLEGEETAAVMRIPVWNGNSYTAIRELIDEWAVRKGFISASSATTSPDRKRSIERLTRLVIGVLNTPERPHRACAFDVVEALLYLAKTQYGGALTVGDMQYGLSQLAPDRLFPSLTPSATKCLQTLLVSDEPMGRSELIETAGVSGRTWDRNWRELAALDVIEPVQEDGYRRWTATLEPWFAAENQEEISSRDDVPQPFDDGDLTHPVSASGQISNERLLSSIALRLGLLTDDEDLVESWRHPEDWPDLDPLSSYLSPSVLDRWRGFLWAMLSPTEEWVNGPPDREDRDVDVAVIGRLPTEADPDQMELTSSAVAGHSLATDGGKPPD